MFYIITRVCIHHRASAFSTFIASACLLFIITSSQAYARSWTLESSIQQAMATSPELKKSAAEIGSRKQEINLSSLWPDPDIGFRVDNKMGQDDGSGGYDVTDITISQPIPVSRIKYQTSAAEASLKAAEFARQYKSLQVQNRVARVFHQLQYAAAELSLAKKQLALADKMQTQSRKNSQGVVVRYLTALEKMRLSIIHEDARQAAASAEGKYAEALSEFVKLLDIDAGAVTEVSDLEPVTSIPDIDHLISLQGRHAQLSSQKQEVLAAKYEIDVARNSQYADPTIGLSWSRDTFFYGRDDIYAIMFNVQIPLSDRKNTAASKATFKASQKRIDLQLLQRELKINLNRSYTHLNHVVEQASEYEKKMLEPARKILTLTSKGFNSGELNILSLVDANNTYFEARLQYLDLIYQARLELADVKLFAGQLLDEKAGQESSQLEGGR